MRSHPALDRHLLLPCFLFFVCLESRCCFVCLEIRLSEAVANFFVNFVGSDVRAEKQGGSINFTHS